SSEATPARPDSPRRGRRTRARRPRLPGSGRRGRRLSRSVGCRRGCHDPLESDGAPRGRGYGRVGQGIGGRPGPTCPLGARWPLARTCSPAAPVGAKVDPEPRILPCRPANMTQRSRTAAHPARARRIATLALALLATFAAAGAVGAQEAFDILIRGARVLDGTGNPWYRADVGITGERIAAVGDLSGRTAVTVVEAEGLYL